jgi:trimethylamine---corrinoid protein Co-methyltransferase
MRRRPAQPAPARQRRCQPRRLRPHAPYRHLRNPFEPLKVFSDDQVAAIHEAALVMLGDAGHEGAVGRCARLYRQGRRRGRRGDDDGAARPRTGGASLATAPRDITLHAVDPERHVPLSNGCVAFAPTSGPPNIMDTSAAGAPARSRISATSSSCARASRSSTCSAAPPSRRTFRCTSGIWTSRARS